MRCLVRIARHSKPKSLRRPEPGVAIRCETNGTKVSPDIPRGIRNGRLQCNFGHSYAQRRGAPGLNIQQIELSLFNSWNHQPATIFGNLDMIDFPIQTQLFDPTRFEDFTPFG